MLTITGRRWRALTLGWGAVIAYLTLVPTDRLPPTPHWALLSFDTAAHAGVFLALAVPLRRWWHASGAAYPVLGTFVVATAYGALIEWLQLTLALGRHAEWTDLLSDGIGAAGGVALAGWRLSSRAGS